MIFYITIHMRMVYGEDIIYVVDWGVWRGCLSVGIVLWYGHVVG